jgi:uncharacterized protein (DUF608 family)
MYRRDALQTILAGMASARVLASPPGSKGRAVDEGSNTLFPTNLPSRDWRQFRAHGLSTPACGVIFRRDRPPERGVPLGAIDTGRINLEQDGRFGHCTIYNSYCPERGPLNVPFLAVTVGKQVYLLSSHQDSYGEYMFNYVEKAKDIHYWGHYPVADLEFDMPGAPVGVGMRAWTPFILGDSAASNTPGAVFELHLRNRTNSAKDGRIVFNFPGPTQAEAQITADSPRQKVPFIPFAHTWIPVAKENTRVMRQVVRGAFSGLVVRSEKVKEIGYALGVIGDAEVHSGGGLIFPESPYKTGQTWSKVGTELPKVGDTHLASSAAEDEGPFGDRWLKARDTDFASSVSVAYQLQAREEKVVRFVLTWFAPMWIGEGSHTFLHMYANRYKDALDVAQFLSHNHESLLRRVLAWQDVIYSEERLPVWLRDSLVNMLYLFPINSLWAAARPPIGPWCRQDDGLFGLMDGIVEDPAIEPIPDTFYANTPLVYFFPDLALSTLRGYKAYQFASGAAVWIFGGVVGESDGGYQMTAGTEFAMPTPGYQTTTNGPCYVDMVDRYWQRTGDDKVLHEFYDSVKRNTTFTMNLRPEDGDDGIISVPSGNIDPQRKADQPGHHLEWFEAILWFGMTSHVGGIHLANLKMAQRMAEKVGDHEFARQCREWFEKGSRSMEDKMWAKGYYLAYSEPKTGKRSDDIFAYQLDGEWMVRFHGLPGVFRSERVKRTLGTITRTCLAVAPEGVANFATAEGKLPQGVGYGAIAYFTPELFMLAMTYMYAGEKDRGMEIARRGMHAMTIVEGSIWNQPNLISGDNGDRLFGSHYDQNMMLWALPAAWEGKDIAGACAPGSFVDRILEAAKGA